MRAKGPSNAQTSPLDGALRDCDRLNRPKLTHCIDRGRFGVEYFSSLLGKNEIICLHCSKAFKIAEAGYADIVKQVRDGEFEQQLNDRLELAEQDKRNAVELAQARAASELQKAASAKNTEIQELKAKLDAGEVARKLAVSEALSAVEKERDALANELEQARRDKQATSDLAAAKRVNELQRAAATKDAEIQDLKARFDAPAVAQRLAITEAVNVVERERDELRSGLDCSGTFTKRSTPSSRWM